MKETKVRIYRGEYGYIDTQKKKQLIKTIIAFLIAAGIFVLGLALNKWQKNNIFTIIAALAVLPAAKIMIRYILIFPFRTSSSEFHQRLEQATESGENVIEDVILATTQKALGFYAIVVTNHMVYACKYREKDDKQKLCDTVGKIIRAWGYHHKVVIAENEEEFFKELKKCEKTEMNDDIQELIKQLRILIP